MKIVTGKCRASYANVFRARLNEMSGKEEYSIALLIPKSDKKTLEALRKAVDHAIAEKWHGKTPAKLRHPLRDGDEEKGDDPNYQGHYWINCKSKDKPGIVDKDRNPVLDPDEFVSGDYCRASLNPYAYDVSGNRGVAFGLGNIQVLAKGEPLSGRARAEDEFSEWNEDGESEFG